MSKRGLSFLEVLMVVVTLVSVAAVAKPKADERARRKEAARLLADVEAVRAATYAFFSDSGYFARSSGGAIPPSMVRYLPTGYMTKRRDWTVGYEYWTNRTQSFHVKTKLQIGITVVTKNPTLGATAMDMYGNNPKYSIGEKYVFMIVGL